MSTVIIYENESIKEILDKINDLISIHGMEIAEVKPHNITLEKGQTIVKRKRRDVGINIERIQNDTRHR